MPGGRRNAASRTGPTGRSGGAYASSTNANGSSNSGERAIGTNVNERRMDETYNGKSLAPKHVPIPVIPVDGQLTFEVVSLGVSILAACLQLLNLYKTVWWLPYTYNIYSIVCYLYRLIATLILDISNRTISKGLRKLQIVHRCFRIFT